VYDELAAFYDLIYQDWEASMRWQGAVLADLLPPVPARVLDASAGIGTQTLPLAEIGYEVVARDLSREAVDRLRREAPARGLDVDAGVADMREVARSVAGSFDAVLSLDNSVPHLLADEQIVAALSGFRSLLAPGGSVLVSVRDYGAVDRTPTSVHPYGERTRDGRRFRAGQRWEWTGPDHYRTTLTVEEETESGWTTRMVVSAMYYAIPIPRLLDLFRRGGLRAEVVEDAGYFQPVVRGRIA